MPADLYIVAREREGRILSDDLVALLPLVPSEHPLFDEWRLRADSARRLTAALQRLQRRLRVVELGCGNGWLAHRIAELPHTDVVGADVNDVELEQARRVFADCRNLRFVHHDMNSGELPVARVDVVVVASAIQYAADPARLIAAWLRQLSPYGEIHILDSPIYTGADVAAARERTRRHYESIGVPAMAGRYHHHTWDVFTPFDADILHRPDAPLSRLRRSRSPFPWLRIRRDANP
jgi:SAM-dependent methyltransferase